MGTWISKALLPLLLLCAVAGCKKYEVSSQGTSSENKRLLYDFRNVPADTAASGAAPLPAAQVFSALFPAYSQRRGTCGKYLGGSRSANPMLLSWKTGSFTTSQTNQAAYLVAPGSCEDDPEGFGESRVAIFERAVLRTSARASANHILGIFDLDEDGVNELLLANGVGDDAGVVTAHLLEFQKETFRVAENFGRVRYETCSTGAPDRTITAATILYLPEAEQKEPLETRGMPRFTAELYRSPCPHARQDLKWVRVQGASR